MGNISLERESEWYTWREQIQGSNSNLKFVRAMRISTSGIGSKSCQKLWLAKFTEYISFHSKRLSHHHFVHLFYIAFWQLRKTFIQKLNSFAWATWMCNICLEGGFFFCFLKGTKKVPFRELLYEAKSKGTKKIPVESSLVQCALYHTQRPYAQSRAI